MTFEIAKAQTASKPDLYESLRSQLRSLLEGEHDFIANAANCAALLYHSLPDVNWVGFYLYKEEELVLGPFQGNPACVRIALGKGVCGTAAQLRQLSSSPMSTSSPATLPAIVLRCLRLWCRS